MEEFLRALYPEWLEKTGQTLPRQPESVERPSSGDSLPADPATPEEQRRVITSLPRRPIPSRLEHPVAVILAGGKGTRMASGVRQKALCPILGRPALLRAIETYRSFGLAHFILIVGIGYQDVLACVGSDTPGMTFLYQEEQLGTGHAARLAARYLRLQRYTGDVLVVMGDKFITPRGFQCLLRDHAARQADLTISTASKTAWPDSGRVVKDEGGRILAIIEKPDLVLSRLLHDFYHWPEDPVPCQALLDRALQYWNRPEKWAKLLGSAFWQALHDYPAISPHDNRIHGWLPKMKDELDFPITPTCRLSGEAIERQCDRVNISAYIFKSAPFLESMERLRSNNAQGELYLTDAVQDLTQRGHSQGYRVFPSAMPHDYDIMGFNTREELEFIERAIVDKGLWAEKFQEDPIP